MARKYRALAKIVCTIILIGISGNACSRSPAPVSVPQGALAGDLLVEPCAFNAGPRTYQADCGRLIVRENRNLAASRLIALPITRIHAARDPANEPIFFLDGGPGESLNMRFKPPALLLE